MCEVETYYSWKTVILICACLIVDQTIFVHVDVYKFHDCVAVIAIVHHIDACVD